MPPTRITKETLYVRHEFNDAERLQMGDDLAQAHNRMSSIEEEEAVMKAQIKDRKAAVEQTIGTLYRNLNNRFEMRNILCSITYDLPNVGEVTYTGPDGAVVKTRAMTETERQMDLPLDDDKQAVVAVMDPAKSAENIAEFFGKVEEIAGGAVEVMAELPAFDPPLLIIEEEYIEETGNPVELPKPTPKSGPRELKEFHDKEVGNAVKRNQKNVKPTAAGDTSDGW